MPFKNNQNNKKVIIIGGGAVGMAVATSLTRHSDYSITVFSADTHTAYSQCGMPFVIGGEIEDFESLVLRSNKYFEEIGIDLHLGTTVDSINIEDNSISSGGNDYHFDRLVIATGSKAKIPAAIPGTSLGNIFTLRTLSDAMTIEEALQKASSVVIVGGGSIGAEMAAAISSRNINTVLLNRSPSILSHNIDSDMAEVVQEHLESLGVKVITGYVPSAMNGEKDISSVTVGSTEFPSDLVIFATGVEPDNELASNAGIDIGDTGGIIVDDYLHPSISGTFHPDIYCGGECIEVTDLITGKAMLSQLASTARRMAGIITNNLTSGPAEFDPILNPWVAVIGNIQVGTTGITSKKAEENNIKIVTGLATGSTRADYYPGGSKLFIKLIFSERYLVGAQVVGREGIKERIDALTLAIKKKTTAQELVKMETCYAPPVSTLQDPTVFAAKGALKKMRRKI
ncbi:NAD(P)/FAD-dependent oxidoreductase [Methanolobus bombayensis]|uniref:NAD(P)/FAD-dependent oxidoreductase n=1 Tax=Methanolobus bombayensis TaxID=38023 RepID=UPI001AE15693|nr:FAD-dependent oxidoreductase [Methanolobus bombayensis]MBP1909511.1 NADH oxidase (H2O2-forming) [Methanolobus bombayensis]